jgi:hypothetical protein
MDKYTLTESLKHKLESQTPGTAMGANRSLRLLPNSNPLKHVKSMTLCCAEMCCLLALVLASPYFTTADQKAVEPDYASTKHT